MAGKVVNKFLIALQPETKTKGGKYLGTKGSPLWLRYFSKKWKRQV